ncbi:MAG: efflux RND transporter periplasmic adaptor subunit [Candidatus Glassbacteria bacterium]|nr:efflux RND transporter periplasmic adaptor subunit [Candidatus Glassbacteria bacterium]
MKVLTVLTTFALAAVLLVAGCGGDDLAVERIEGGTVRAPVVTVTADKFPLYTTAMGTVEPYDRARLSTRVMGHVLAVLVEEGDRVTAGQVLLRLDSKDMVSRIEQDKAGLAAAESQLENAEAYYNRIKKLYDEQSATKQNLDNARTQYEAASAGADAARNKLTGARSQLDYFNIKAPFSGFVTGRTVDKGDMGAPGAPLVTVEMQDSLKIVTSLSEKDVGRVSVGQSALVEIGSGQFQARVESVVPAGDPATRRFKVQLVLPNEDGTLVSGMFARVLFRTGTDETISVPETAIVRRGQLTGLFVLDDENTTRLRWVRLGRTSGERVEVLSGLTAGERIVTGKLRQMREGVTVQEVNS